MGSVMMAALMKSGLVLMVVLGMALAKKENVFARLIDDLFTDSGYEKDAIPMEKPADKESNVNAIDVGVGMSIIDMDYEPSGVLTTSTWFKAVWPDYRLKWDPDHYDGITNIKVPASRIWTPDLSAYNAADFGSGSFADRYAHSPTNAIIYNTGKVLWIPPIPMKVYCQNDLKISPDPSDNYALECSIKIGSWTYDGYHLNLTTYAGEALETKYYDCCKEPYVSMNYRFTIQKSYDIV